MALIWRYLVSLSSCLVIALGAAAGCAANLAIGVNVVNPQRLAPAARAAILDELKASAVRVIRVPLEPPWSGGNYGPAIDFIGRSYERGIKTDLIVGLVYRKEAPRRLAVKTLPNMWPAYPLSAADPTRFRVVFEPLLRRFEEMGITFAALELGNEINWAAFNGDFPIPGTGKVFGVADLASDPEARRVAAGYRAYLQTMKVLKDIRDHSRLNKHTPILSAGLSDPGPSGLRPWSRADAVTIRATLEYLRANGIDALVDGYGVHAYPSASSTALHRLAQLKQDTLSECRSPSAGKPCWLTEWGLPGGNSAGCPDSDGPPAALIGELLDDFHWFVRQGRLRGMIYYAWVDDKYGIYRCARLTAAGRVALAPEER
jgi:hypothetical protein